MVARPRDRVVVTVTRPAENQQTVEAALGWFNLRTIDAGKVERMQAAIAALRDLVAQAELAREALEVIAAEDDLVLSNSSAFSIHAFR